MNAAQKQQITFMRENGAGYKEIARVMNIPLNTVQSFCRRYNLTGDRRKMRLEDPVQESLEMEFLVIGSRENCVALKQYMSHEVHGSRDDWPIFKVKVSLADLPHRS